MPADPRPRPAAQHHDNAAAAVETPENRAGVGEDVNKRKTGNRHVRFLQPIILSCVAASKNQVSVSQHNSFGVSGGS